METTDGKDHIGKLPGDDGWFKLASTPKVLVWSLTLILLIALVVPVILVLPGVEIPTRVQLGLGGMYVAALLGIAGGTDRAVQLERIRRRQ